MRTLLEATRGELARSRRYRELIEPLGLGDEIRAVLRTGGSVWGFMCLHRAATAPPLSPDERAWLRAVVPHLAAGVRAGLLHAGADAVPVADAAGLLTLAPDGSLLALTDAGARWLEELGYSPGVGAPAPEPVHPVAARLRAIDTGRSSAESVPRLRVRAPSGRWAVLHASWLHQEGGELQVAVLIEEAATVEVASLIVQAYGLTQAECRVTGLVCRGLSTQEISAELSISANTVQDHLKSVFNKVGVGSRGQLVAAILHQQYAPRVRRGDAVGPDGFFC